MKATKEFLDYLTNFTFTKLSATQMYVNGARYTYSKFISEVLNPQLMKSFNMLDFIAIPSHEQIPALKSYINRLVSDGLSDKLKDLDSEELIDSRIDRSNYILIRDVKTAHSLLYNKTIKSVSDLSVAVWLEGMTKEEKGLSSMLARDALLMYNPYDITPLGSTTFEDNEILTVNMYNPPPWRFLKQTGEATCPPLVAKLFKHMFPDPKSYEYVLSWLHHALLNRNETYLVLNGKKGAGKGLFSQLTSLLVGRKYYTEAPVGFLDSNFNSALDKKRIILLDEFMVTKREHTRLKRYINKYQNVEKKNVDADATMETFNSFIINNNDETDMYVEPDDRRFSVPDLTTELLKTSMTKSEIDTLARLIESEDEAFTAQFGYFIYSHIPKYDNHDPFLGRHFFRLVHTSLSEWKKYLVDKIVYGNRPTYKLQTLRRDYNEMQGKRGSQFPSNADRIANFLMNYAHNGDTEIAHLERDSSSGWDVVVNPALLSNIPAPVDQKSFYEIEGTEL